MPLETLVRKFKHSRFEPSGWTRNKAIPHADSILDYVFRWMGLRYLPGDRSDAAAAQAPLPLVEEEEAAPAPTPSGDVALPDFLRAHPPVEGGQDGADALRQSSGHGFQNQLDAPPCSECGHIMVRNGSCYRCYNCGATSGCS